MINAGIIGSTGYAGSELVRILLQHPSVNLKLLNSRSYIGKNFNAVYDNFNKFCDIECSDLKIEDMANEVDVIFLALPHGIASKQVTQDILSKTKIIDIGADFRLKSQEIYESWYKTKHHSPELLNQAVYGLSEWKREEIKKSPLIANPGCYTTCSLLPLYPLMKENIIDKNSIIIDAKSGVSGAGRALNLGTHFIECNDSIKAYKIASHRHTPEIEQQLSEVSGQQIQVSFTPHLIPMNRGILATCYVNLEQDSIGISEEEIKQIYETYYKDEYFIRIMNQGVYPETRWVKNSNFCDIGFKLDERTNRIVIICAIDNMVKGAAGQAVQNLNIMFDIDEKTGINYIPTFP